MDYPTICESGWTGDRCTFPIDHEGPHSNDDLANAALESLEVVNRYPHAVDFSYLGELYRYYYVEEAVTLPDGSDMEAAPFREEFGFDPASI